MTDEVVARFGVHLDVARGLSPHTVRAYLGDVRHVLAFASRHGARGTRSTSPCFAHGSRRWSLPG